MAQITVTFDQAVADRLREAYKSNTIAAIPGSPTDAEIAAGIKGEWILELKRTVRRHEDQVAKRAIEDAKDADEIVVT